MLIITTENLLKWSKYYDDYFNVPNRIHYQETEKRLKTLLKKQRYLNRPEFIELCRWKTPRQLKNYEKNGDKLVRDTTIINFSTNDEEKRITILMDLKGVGWAVASAILHFAFPNNYSILDFRALESLGWKEGPSDYNYIFWQRYCNRMLKISRQLALPIRTIDKALWQYSKFQTKFTRCM
jgi:hypothetical protein